MQSLKNLKPKKIVADPSKSRLKQHKPTEKKAHSTSESAKALYGGNATKTPVSTKTTTQQAVTKKQVVAKATQAK